MDKKVSIVLPVYNGEKRVAKAIDSILNQTYSNFELIIVNDCSTDNTKDVLEKYAIKDSRIRIVSNEINLKLPNSLNHGFEEATGDYYTWTSDDNAYKPDAISVMVDYLDSNDDVDMVYCDFDVVGLDGTYISTTELLEPDELRFQNAVGACFLYRKELAQKVGKYDADLFLAEDYEYWMKAYLNGNLHHIPQVLYEYGWHDESLTVKKRHQVYHKTYEAKDKHFEELISRCKTQDDKNKFYWNMLRLLLDDEERETVRNKYYQLDSEFMKADKAMLKQERFGKSFLTRVLRKLKGIFV